MLTLESFFHTNPLASCRLPAPTHLLVEKLAFAPLCLPASTDWPRRLAVDYVNFALIRSNFSAFSLVAVTRQ